MRAGTQVQSRGSSPAKPLSVSALAQRDALDNVPFTPSQGVVTPSPSNRALPPWQTEALQKGFTRSPDTVLRLEAELAKTTDSASPERPAPPPPPESVQAAPDAEPGEQQPKRMNARQRRTERRRLEREAREQEARGQEAQPPSGDVEAQEQPDGGVPGGE